MPDAPARTPDWLRREASRFGFSTDVLNRLHDDVDWIADFRRERIAEAYAHLSREEPFPEMASHIRPDPFAVDDLSLRQLRYMLAWIARDRDLTGIAIPDHATGFHLAVVGAGPAGLSATLRLLEQGHTVSLFEREQHAGGAPALVYPEERLPDPQDEIEARLKPALARGQLILHFGSEASAPALAEDHDAVVLATGCWKEPSLGRTEGVWPALHFLREARAGRCPSVPEHVILLCGGDAAMDAAVTAKKLGAARLDLLFSTTRDNAHWHLPRDWFDQPGVQAQFGIQATGYRCTEDGRVKEVVLHDGQTISTPMVIEAMGLFGDEDTPSSKKIFRAGAIVNGGASVQQCMREGLSVADEVHHVLGERRS